MKTGYPSYTDPDDDTWAATAKHRAAKDRDADFESTYDAAAWERAAKDREWLEREVITPSQASKPVRDQRSGNAWGWVFIGAALFWAGIGIAYTLDVYWTKQIDASFTDDYKP